MDEKIVQIYIILSHKSKRKPKRTKINLKKFGSQKIAPIFEDKF